MYSQANVRAGKWLRSPPRALPSVIVDTEKVLREADGPMKRAVPRPAMRDGWKGVRPRVRLKSRQTVRAGRSPKNTTASRKDDLTDIDMVRSLETGNNLRPTS